MSEIITLANVTKRFAGLTAIDDLSFTVNTGEAVALWGANGAGKTTALRCLLGLALALALLADPPILVLDEPTANLDISARENFLMLLHDLKVGGKTLAFSSLRLEEVTAVADRVLLMEAGRLVVDAPPRELGKSLGWESTLHLYLPDQGVEPALETLTEYGIPVSRNGRGIRVQVKSGEKGKVLQILYNAGIEVEDFTVE